MADEGIKVLFTMQVGQAINDASKLRQSIDALKKDLQVMVDQAKQAGVSYTQLADRIKVYAETLSRLKKESLQTKEEDKITGGSKMVWVEGGAEAYRRFSKELSIATEETLRMAKAQAILSTGTKEVNNDLAQSNTNYSEYNPKLAPVIQQVNSVISANNVNKGSLKELAQVQKSLIDSYTQTKLEPIKAKIEAGQYDPAELAKAMDDIKTYEQFVKDAVKRVRQEWVTQQKAKAKETADTNAAMPPR